MQKTINLSQSVTEQRAKKIVMLGDKPPCHRAKTKKFCSLGDKRNGYDKSVTIFLEKPHLSTAVVGDGGR